MTLRCLRLPVAARYAPGGPFWASRSDLAVTPLAGIELWNEPYGNWFFKPTPSASNYATLARLSAAAIHAADPLVPVVAAANLMQKSANGAISPWISAVLNAEPTLAKLIDVWAVHPYETYRQVGPDGGPKQDDRFGFGSIPAVHAVLAARGITSPVWVTEIGWSTAPDADGAVSPAQQASFITRALQRSLDDWGSYVKRVYIFSWDVSTGNSRDFDANQGLRRPDGSTKPGWQSVKSFIGSA